MHGNFDLKPDVKMAALTEAHVFNGGLDHFSPGLDGRLVHHNVTKCEDAVVPMMGPPPAGNMNRKMLCQVCGALSSGLHFGVFTCEGCKCFYRRSIKEGANYACAKERSCEITMETRNSCRYCRFQKCLALGMSKEGIKLGRRPKVDSDAFQHGFYPPDVEYHTHGYWTSMEHAPTFKTEPVFSKSDELRDRLVYGDAAALNYAMKPEPYPTCGQQPDGLHYGQDGYSRPHPDAEQLNGHQMHFSDPNWKSERHLPVYHNPHGGMPPEMYMEQPHSQGGQFQTWTSELSPTTSGSGSEDNWDSGSVMHNRVPASVSLTLPEVQSGAAAAMAYANLYRGKNDTNEKVLSKCKTEGAVQNTQLESHRSNSTSYTELVPRKDKTDLADAHHHLANQSVSLYHESKHKTLRSPSRAGTGSVSPHHIKANTGEAVSPHMTWLETASSPGKRKSPEQLSEVGKVRKLSNSTHSDSENLCKAEQIRLIQDLMDNFLPLERVVSYQWEAYLQSYGEQVFCDMQPRYKDSAHLTAFVKTHGEEVLYQIRKFATNLPGFDELSQSQKDSLLRCTAPSIITTCLLQSECGSSDGDKHEKGSVSSVDEGACFCAIILLMAGKKSKTLDNELCTKLSLVIEDYVNETLTRRDPEKLQWLLQQLQQKSYWQDPKE